jgi:hypothetical protein
MKENLKKIYSLQSSGRFSKISLPFVAAIAV